MNVLTAPWPRHHPVRLPLRVAAGFVVVLGVAAVTGTAYAAVAGKLLPVRLWQILAFLPLGMGFVRAMWHASRHGKSPPDLHWPFASERFMAGYLFLLLVASLP